MLKREITYHLNLFKIKKNKRAIDAKLPKNDINKKQLKVKMNSKKVIKSGKDVASFFMWVNY